MTTTQTDENKAHAPKITTYDNAGMSAINRCDRCGGQAYVEVQMKEAKNPLLFCAHDFNTHEDKILSLEACVAIIDHRPFLKAQETGVRDAASAAN